MHGRSRPEFSQHNLLTNWKAYTLGLFIFLLFSIWAFVKAPYQAPDEFAHYLKTVSVYIDPWLPSGALVRVPKTLENPLTFDSKLNAIPFYHQRKILRSDFKRFHALQWPSDYPLPLSERECSAAHYPPLFFLTTFVLGQGATTLFDLSPLSSHYAFRLSVAFMTTMLWMWFWYLLGQTAFRAYRTVLTISVVLIPMLAFMSSSINPDALFFPLSAIACVASVHALTEGKLRGHAFTALLLACLVKQAGWLVGLAIAVVGIVRVIEHLWSRGPLRTIFSNLFLVTLMPIIISWLLYYAWLPVGAAPNQTSQVNPFQLWSNIPLRLWDFWVQSLGLLGWTDYRVNDWYYRVVLWLWGLNLILFFFSTRSGPVAKATHLLFMIFIIHTLALFTLEFLLVEDNPTFILQGRYLLPVAVGALVVLCHGWRSVQVIFVACLLVLNAALLYRTMVRYYAPALRSPWKLVKAITSATTKSESEVAEFTQEIPPA